MKRKWDEAFRPTPEVFRVGMDKAFQTIEEGINVKKAYKLSALLVAALCVALLVGGIALAASIGVFDWASNRTGDENQKERFGAVNELAREDVQTRASADGETRVELRQSLYTGNELYAGYKLYERANRLDAAFEPDSELIGRIKAAYNLTDAESVALPIDAQVSAAVEALVNRTYAGDEYGCVAYYMDYIGDHKYILVGDTEYDVFTTEQDEESVDGVTTGYFVLGDDSGYEEYALPDIDEADDIALVMTLKHSVVYYYKDASGFYRFLEPSADSEKFSFDVQRAEKTARVGGAEAEYDDYSVSISLEASDVATRARIVLKYAKDGALTNQWHDEEQLRASGKDALGYYAMIVGGAPCEGFESEHDVSEGDMIILEQTYIFPCVSEELSEITLRPRYILAGEDASKDIVISLN